MGKNKKNSDIFNGFIIILLFVINILSYKHSRTAGYSIFKVFIGDIFVVLFILGVPYINCYMNFIVRNIIKWGLTILTPVFVFVLAELITKNLTTVSAQYIVKNIIIYYIFYAFFVCCFRKIKTASIIYSIVFIILALVYHYVLEFRGRPFMIMDIEGLNTALTVAETYSYYVTTRIGVCVQILIIYFILQFYFQDIEIGKIKIWAGVRFAGIVSFVIICYLLINTNILKKYNFENIDMWNLLANYEQKGLLYTLFLECQYMYIEKPEGYSVEMVKQIAERVSNIQKENVIQPENLIVIMNESFSDLEVFGAIDTNEELLPFLKKGKDNLIKGWLYAPVFGGGTSDAEYEVLTGNSKEFLTEGSFAYQVYCNNPEYGMALNLKQEGYSTVALHPYIASNWNRDTVYQAMGFDKFLSRSNWSYPTENIRNWVSDESCYNKVISMVEDKQPGEKLFTFLVTIQNHGSYSNEGNNFTPTVTLNYTIEYPQAEVYLSLVNETDKALEKLIEHFEKVDETTMIVMFGDHQPSVEEQFYEELFQKTRWELSLEEYQERYKVPYIIWTNYEQEFEAEEMSFNYFGSYIMQQTGMTLTGYDQFLLNMKEKIPVIGKSAICDADGNWYAMDALPEEYDELINEYKIMQYNNVFDRKNTVEEVFAK